MTECKNQVHINTNQESYFNQLYTYFYNFSGIDVTEPELDQSTYVYNPYPTLGAPESPCWPRGFPMEKVLESFSTTDGKLSSVESPTKFGILQSLADIQPDVDAIFRLTHKTPFIFNKGMYNK